MSPFQDASALVSSPARFAELLRVTDPCSFVVLAFRALGSLDEFPKLWILLQRLVFTRLEARAEEKILERVPAQNSMHQHAKLVALEIDPIIPHAKSVQDMAIAFQLAEIIEFTASTSPIYPATRREATLLPASFCYSSLSLEPSVATNVTNTINSTKARNHQMAPP